MENEETVTEYPFPTKDISPPPQFYSVLACWLLFDLFVLFARFHSPAVQAIYSSVAAKTTPQQTLFFLSHHSLPGPLYTRNSSDAAV